MRSQKKIDHGKPGVILIPKYKEILLIFEGDQGQDRSILKPIDALDLAYNINHSIFEHLKSLVSSNIKDDYEIPEEEKTPEIWVEKDMVHIDWEDESTRRALSFFDALTFSKELNECVICAMTQGFRIGTN